MAGDAFVEIVGGLAEDEREQDPDAVGEQDAERAERVAPAIALQVGQERAQTLGQHAGSVGQILAGSCAEVLGARVWGGMVIFFCAFL